MLREIAKMFKFIVVSRETETNSNRENALEAIKLEAAQLAIELGRPVQIRSEQVTGRIIDTFEPA